VVRDYLADVATMVSNPAAFEEDFRYALRLTAQSGRALEVNTRLPLHATVLTWWHDEGGDAITFGSDAHLPAFVGHGFREAAQMAEAHGFLPGDNPHDLWERVD
jgi:histidinol-phosphatase (PHP family)